MDRSASLPSHTAKSQVDLVKGKVDGEIHFGSNVYGGESVFVHAFEDFSVATEDDGYLMTYVYDELDKVKTSTLHSDLVSPLLPSYPLLNERLSGVNECLMVTEIIFRHIRCQDDEFRASN